MAKISLKDTRGGYDLSSLNSNFQKLEQELQDKVLYRDNPTGEPNQLESDIDLNGHRVINAGAPTRPTDLVRLKDLQGGEDAEPGDIIINYNGIQPYSLSAAVSNPDAEEGQIVQITDRDNGQFRYVLALDFPPNSYDIVQCTGVPYLALKLILRIDTTIDALGGVPNDPFFDNSPVLSAFRDISSVRTLGFGDYYISEASTVTHSEVLRGQGRRGLSALVTLSNTINAIEIVTNSRAWIIEKLDIRSAVQSSMAGIKSPSGVRGGAEGKIDEVNISETLDHGILAYNDFWNNKISNMRINSKYGIHILGSDGTSISNDFQNVYVDATGLANPVCVKLSATKNNTFLNCNFGGSEDPSGGQFVVTESSNNATRFIGCNFEKMFVADNTQAFRHIAASVIDYASCTFIALEGNGAGSGSTILFAEQNSSINLTSCDFGQNLPTTEYNIYARGGRVTAINSPLFVDQSKIKYETYLGVVPQYIFDSGTVKTAINEVEKVAREQSATSETVGKSLVNKFSVSSTATTPVLTFTYDTPANSSSAAIMAGTVAASVSTRNTSGQRNTAYARWDVYFSNEGNALIARQVNQSIGVRTMDLALIQNGDALELDITSSADEDSGVATVEANMLKSINEFSDIDFNMG